MSLPTRKIGIVSLCYYYDLDSVKKAIEHGEYSELELNIGTYIAAREGNLDLIKYLFNKGAINYNEVISRACEYDNVDIVNEMLDRGANDYYRAFKSSCVSGNLDLVKKFLGFGIGIGGINDGFINACLNGNINVVKYLIEHYSEPITDDPEGFLDDVFDICSGFDYACDEGYVEVVEYLLDTYSDPGVQYDTMILKILEISKHGCASVVIKLLISRSGFNITTEYDRSFTRYFEYLSKDLITKQRYLFLDKILNDDLIRLINV